MDAELKAKWVKALRSGEYKQGTGYLHGSQTNTYCCLGVLCKAGLGLVGEATNRGVTAFDGSVCLLSYSLRDRTGLSCAQEKELVDLNDDYHKTFPEIADWIEANL
jgi:hypothetical protein